MKNTQTTKYIQIAIILMFCFCIFSCSEKKSNQDLPDSYMTEETKNGFVQRVYYENGHKISSVVTKDSNIVQRSSYHNGKVSSRESIIYGTDVINTMVIFIDGKLDEYLSSYGIVKRKNDSTLSISFGGDLLSINVTTLPFLKKDMLPIILWKRDTSFLVKEVIDTNTIDVSLIKNKRRQSFVVEVFRPIPNKPDDYLGKVQSRWILQIHNNNIQEGAFFNTVYLDD